MIPVLIRKMICEIANMSCSSSQLGNLGFRDLTWTLMKVNNVKIKDEKYKN